MEHSPAFQVPAPNTYRRARLGRVVQQPGVTRGMPVPTTYHLMAVHTGHVSLSRGSRPPTTIPPGSAVLLRPQDLSHRRTTAGPSYQTWVAVVPDELSLTQRELLDAAPEVLPLSPTQARLQASIIETAITLHAERDEAAEAVLAPLIVGALMLYVQEAREAGLLQRPERLHPAVAAAREMVRRRLNERIGLRDMAAVAHVSPEHLVRLFHQELDTTPSRYLWAERIRQGVHLLEHSSLPIAEVAHSAGFQTASHFSRTIHQAAGLRPGVLRRRALAAATGPGDTVLSGA